MFAICHLAIVPLRFEPSDRSEMVSQVLFGETFTILEKREKWSKIQLTADEYEGWIDNKQYTEISVDQFNQIKQNPKFYCADLIDYVTGTNTLLPISLGSNLSFLSLSEINKDQLVFEGKAITGTQPKTNLLQTAFLYLNAPYLWGGKTPFGIDCSGFTQMVYRLNGYSIPRDASQQARIGEALSFIEESEVGDLAFFDNDEGNIVHVGIIMENNYIIHAHGKVRIDRLDHLGILNIDSGRHTHKLRVIKKII
ncbi:C40 family peptidase [Flavobacterium sp. xlx-214]|uniref:C40 family peptidase n=1 Tax=unclassified Flavobacterium TaxID=196869 RepID=UPI0013CFB011|nr:MULTISPECIES: C40 family peptidase [unclassified Flavobacterium]MBA5793217.1 C40 family peptidase [Flavobacterium sp. xlx-221]QMI82500.1 C40 family peptidase [Flavobacterium sp. xlx-214]